MAKYIRREDLLSYADEIQPSPNSYFNVGKTEEQILDKQNEIAKELKNLPVVEISYWISVNNRLPDETGGYLVNVQDENGGGIVLAAWFNADVLQTNLVNKSYGWSLLNEFYDLSAGIRPNITHWMPYPNPIINNKEV